MYLWGWCIGARANTTLIHSKMGMERNQRINFIVWLYFVWFLQCCLLYIFFYCSNIEYATNKQTNKKETLSFLIYIIHIPIIDVNMFWGCYYYYLSTHANDGGYLLVYEWSQHTVKSTVQFGYSFVFFFNFCTEFRILPFWFFVYQNKLFMSIVHGQYIMYYSICWPKLTNSLTSLHLYFEFRLLNLIR